MPSLLLWTLSMRKKKKLQDNENHTKANQRLIQKSFKQLRRVFRKTLHLRCMTGFWISLCKLQHWFRNSPLSLLYENLIWKLSQMPQENNCVQAFFSKSVGSCQATLLKREKKKTGACIILLNQWNFCRTALGDCFHWLVRIVDTAEKRIRSFCELQVQLNLISNSYHWPWMFFYLSQTLNVFFFY